MIHQHFYYLNIYYSFFFPSFILLHYVSLSSSLSTYILLLPSYSAWLVYFSSLLSINISVSQGTNWKSCICRKFVMLPVARVVYQQSSVEAVWLFFPSSCLLTRTHKFSKPYVLLYIQFKGCSFLLDIDYCAMHQCIHMFNCMLFGYD